MRSLLPLFITIAFSCNVNLSAQDTTNYDRLFENARKEAFEKKDNSSARTLCRKILDKKPLYIDARVLIANTLSWERRFKEAREEVEKVLEIKPEYRDAIVVLLNIEFWSGNYKQALNVADKGISLFPNDYHFKLVKAKILDQLEEYPEALRILEELKKPVESSGGASSGLMELPPQDMLDEINKLIEEIRIKMLRNHIGALYTLEVLNKVYEPRHLLELEGKRKFGRNALILRFAGARRFGRDGLQLELDYYRKLNKLNYLYLNAGYSPSAIFPNYRAGIEWYHRLPKNMDCSIGARYLLFNLGDDSLKHIFIFTGSLGKYYSNYWFGIRPFITPRGTGAAISVLAHARRYLKNFDSHLTLTIGYGLTPENRVFLAENADFYQVKAARMGMNLQKEIRKNYFLLAGITIENQDLSTLPGVPIFDGIFEIGFRYRF